MLGSKSTGGSTAGGGVSSLPSGFSDDVFSMLNENLDELEINREEVWNPSLTLVRRVETPRPLSFFTLFLLVLLP